MNNNYIKITTKNQRQLERVIRWLKLECAFDGTFKNHKGLYGYKTFNEHITFHFKYNMGNKSKYERQRR